MLLRLRPTFRHRYQNSNMNDLGTLPEMREAVRDVVLFLTSANSFAALLFAVSFGFCSPTAHCPVPLGCVYTRKVKSPRRSLRMT